MSRLNVVSRVIAISLLVVFQSGFAQEKTDSLSEIVNAVDTVVINKQLPRYILRWTDVKKPSDVSHPLPNLVGKIEIRREGDATLLQTITDSTGGIVNDTVIDVNFDGYKDLQLNENLSQERNESSTFFLFNKEKGTFEYSEPFSRFTNAGVHVRDSIIVSSVYRGSHGDAIEYYKVINGLPVLVKREVNTCDTVSIAELIHARWTVIKQTSFTEKQDSLCGGCTEVIYEKPFERRLRVVKKEIWLPIYSELTSTQRRSGLYYEQGPCGNFMLQERLTYTYKKNKKGKKYRDIVQRSVVENRLKVIKRWREYL